MTTHLDQIQKCGSNRGTARVCLWNRCLADAGFAIGTPIRITVERGGLTIVPDPAGKRRVAKVTNHGNVLPVIDLKSTKVLDLSVVGFPGSHVRVVVGTDRIRITPVDA